VIVRPIGRAYASPYELSPRMRTDFDEVLSMLAEAKASPRTRRVLARGEVTIPA
jgi:hypothetical protein